MVICVPRLETKGRIYHPARVLARAIASELDLPFCPEVLKQVRSKQTQHTLNLLQRGKNVENLYQIAAPSVIYNKSVLLVDDVVTSGATFYACTLELNRCGAGEVVCLAVAATEK